jgi:N6-adenosine-specific RNA methylase IME4
MMTMMLDAESGGGGGGLVPATRAIALTDRALVPAPDGAVALIRYENARRALAAAHSVDEVRDIRDRAQALQAYARQAKDTELEDMAAEIKLRAQRRLGELLKEIPVVPAHVSGAAAGGRGKRRLSGGCPTAHTPSSGWRHIAAKAAGISRTEWHRDIALAEVPEGEFEAYIQGQKQRGRPVNAETAVRTTTARARRAAKYAALKGKAAALPAKVFHVIYADPPWPFQASITEDRRTDNHYPVMSLDDIKGLAMDDVDGRRRTVAEIAAPDAVLYLWATASGLVEALAVMGAWGFESRSSMVWVKPSIGLGHWVRTRHEHLLIGVRGAMPVPPEEARPDSVIEAPRGRHSEKPERAYEIIEAAYPECANSRLELFARARRPGWEAWGNEVPITIEGQQEALRLVPAA